MGSLFALRLGGVTSALLWGPGIFVFLYGLFRLPVFKEILASLADMPQVMKQIWWVKPFTWYGLPLMWQFLSLACQICF
ncbi:MAG: hypothetical protein IPP42_01315 [Saprospiraceae bacterium]|nr:hypothetical protein [Saprospiraceae bacterium]